MLTSTNIKQWPLIPTNAFLYFPEGNQIKQGNGEKQWRKIFQDGQPYDDFQNKKLNQLQKKLKQQKIVPHQWFDKANKLRFLQANKFQLSDTCKSIKQGSLWRKNSFPLQPNPQAFERLKQGTIYYCGRDNQYRPILVIEVTRMRDYSQSVIQAILNNVLQFTIENLLIPGQVQNYVLFINLNDAGLSDKGVVQKIVGFTGNTYRSRLYASYLLNTPFVISAGWNALASSLVSENTRRKIKISKNQYHQDMWNHIDKNIIERKYGGNMNQITENFWPPNQKLMNYCNPISEKTMKLKSKAQYNQAYKAGILQNRKIKFSLLQKQLMTSQKQKKQQKTEMQHSALTIQNKKINQTSLKNETKIHSLQANKLINLLPKERVKLQNLPKIRKRQFKLFFQEQKFLSATRNS